ncbi:MAG TPA: bacteriohemerythrin, partial [Azonexus sp.]|nr:bacteriohemerythrin [Azonexus sp.]
MDTFVWNDRYLTGESLVDTEHQELVRIINLVGALEAGENSDPVAVQTILEELVRYAVNHFSHEETLMTDAGCDERHVSMHQRIHREFASQVTAMRQVSMGAEDTESLLRFLSNWLAYHILGIDQVMTRQVQHIRQGMTPAEAYALESGKKVDPATASLLDALNSLYRVIASRNQALVDLNRTLEQRVTERTAALQAANAQLVVEQAELKIAMETVRTTQMRLFESERKRSLETKRNMELLLAQIVDGDPVPTLVINAQHKVTHWNKACSLVTGVSAEEMIGTSRHWS